MIASKATLISYLLFALAIFAYSHTIQTDLLPHLAYLNGNLLSSGRLLQVLPVSNPQVLPAINTQVTSAINQIISDSNTARKAKGKPALSVNSSLQQIMKQWAVSIKGRMSLSKYLQLYGIHSSQAYTFASVPISYLVQVVQKGSPALTDPDFTGIGTYSKAVDGQNYDIIIVLQGGYDSLQKDLSNGDVLAIIKEIESQKAKSLVITNQAIATPNYTVNTSEPFDSSGPSIKQTNPTKDNSSKTNSIPNSSLISNQKVEIPPSKVLPTVQTKTNDSLVPKQQSQQQAKPQQNTPQDIINIPIKVIPSIQDFPKQNVDSQPLNTIPSIQPNPIIPTKNIPTIQDIPKAAVDFQPPKIIPNIQPSPKTFNSPSQQPLALKNIATFKNIILTHNIPTAFVKNEIFPFKGYITAPNPSGVKVNVIFTRVTDQKRLTFNSYLPPNTTDFEVLASLTLSGNYYISIFIGQQGSTSTVQYTIIPSVFGVKQTTSPSPLADVALTLKGNDLWLDWNSTEATLPALTQIIFSQQSGVSIQFLLSNFKTSFQVPYSQFTAFSEGLTSISIAQAFSSSESAANRTSDFSAPYSIIFNATTHNFAKFTGSKAFQSIPYRIDANGKVDIKGVVPAGGVQNQVILLSPSKHFLSYFIDGNNKNKLVNAGVSVDLSIPLNQTGVYICEVNNAAGQALINTPLYVGDILPLLPDFVDLAPTSQDYAALNQPSDLDSRRSIVSELVNAVRSRFGAANLYLDNNLNNLAQNYSSTLIQQQFFSHTDKQGNTPSMRAKAAGITQKVCQNLALNSNLTQAQLMLQRSPAHLRNMVDPAWTRVGLGIVQNSNQIYYLTEQFSSRDMTLYPLTNSELASIQKSILNYIQSKFPYLKTQDKQLSSDLNNYQQTNSNADVLAYLNGLGYRHVGVDEVQISYNAGNFIQNLGAEDCFEPKQLFGKVGVSVIYKDGKLFIQAAYN